MSDEQTRTQAEIDANYVDARLSDTELWERGELGNDERYVAQAPPIDDLESSEAAGLQRVDGVYFTPMTYQRIKLEATKRGIEVSEMVQLLAKRGLDT